MKHRTHDRVSGLFVKAMASIAKGIAKDSVDSRCYLLLHQPKEPENLVARLKSMEK